MKTNKTISKKMSRTLKIGFSIFSAIVILLCTSSIAFATDDPLVAVNNLSEFGAPVSNR